MGTQSKSTCKRCSVSFKGKVDWQKYCSNLCRMMAWAIKKLEEDGYKVVKADE